MADHVLDTVAWIPEPLATLVEPTHPDAPPRIDPAHRPTPLAQHDKLRALTAAHHAKLQYPGPAGELLAAEITSYAELSYLAQPSAAVRRLIDELMRWPA